jgi:hypothetical protein
MLLGRAATTTWDACDPHPAPVLTSSLGALGVAIWAALGPDRALGAEAASLAGILVTGGAVSAWLIDSARRKVSAERTWIAGALTIPGRESRTTRALRGGAQEAPGKGKVLDLRSGEQVMVEAGEVVPVDVTITSGDVDVLPWIGATTCPPPPGAAVVAGARVVRGRLRGVCTWAGHDRASPAYLDPRRRRRARARGAGRARARERGDRRRRLGAIAAPGPAEPDRDRHDRLRGPRGQTF